MNKPLICIVLGTRPEAIKLAPVIIKFQESNNFLIKIISTGQHLEMVEDVFNTFNLKIDINLEIMKFNQSLNYMTSKILEKLVEIFSDLNPSLVIVQGDTSSAFSASLASFYIKVPVAHVEAGLRTDNIYSPFPEEMNRRLISQIAAYNFAPTEKSYKNLIKSNLLGKTYLTGNTVIDSLRIISNDISKPYFYNEKIKCKRIIFATIHRRENWNNIFEFAKGLKKIINNFEDTILILPLHPNKIISEPLNRYLSNIPRIMLVKPLTYRELVFVLKNCYFVITDSGGLQEEAPSFGKPVLIFRENTEREEVINSGNAKLVGTNAINLESHAKDLLTNEDKYKKMANAIHPFGDGYASDKIFEICSSNLLV